VGRPWLQNEPVETALVQPVADPLERTVKVYQILFIVWGIVFAFWLFRQFARYNKDRENRK